MSRKTIYQDSKLTLVAGNDHMLGNFLQLFNKELQDETPEGEGLIFDWSQKFGVEINYTGIGVADKKPIEICMEYIDEN
jgi:hypothetical protein